MLECNSLLMQTLHVFVVILRALILNPTNFNVENLKYGQQKPHKNAPF